MPGTDLIRDVRQLIITEPLASAAELYVGGCGGSRLSQVAWVVLNSSGAMRLELTRDVGFADEEGLSIDGDRAELRLAVCSTPRRIDLVELRALLLGAENRPHWLGALDALKIVEDCGYDELADDPSDAFDALAQLRWHYDYQQA